MERVRVTKENIHLRNDLPDMERLYRAFPRVLHDDVERVMDLLPWRRDIVQEDGKVIHDVDSLLNPSEFEACIDGEEVVIPLRVYFNEPDESKEELLTELQRTILNCIYLRHHNGFVRQRRLEQLIGKNDYFIMPYVFVLLGEYVIEILAVIERHINLISGSNYVRFIRENEKMWQRTERRVVSYWNEYYRRKFPVLGEYVGKRIISRIKGEDGI